MMTYVASASASVSETVPPAHPSHEREGTHVMMRAWLFSPE